MFLNPTQFPYGRIFWLFMVGLSFSSLASLFSWPLSLSIVTYLQQIKKHRSYNTLRKLIHFFATLPLVLFCFIFIEVFGGDFFGSFEVFWSKSFATPNLFTQAIAFAFTLLIYPLTLFPVFSKNYTVAEFFSEVSRSIHQFAEVGLVSSVLILTLTVFILPQMVLLMLDHFDSKENQRSYEVVQSLGGTRWESIHLSVLQNMKSRFFELILRFTRICFFEGLITFSVLHYFFNVSSASLLNWGLSLSSLTVLLSTEGVLQKEVYFLSGLLLFSFFAFYSCEKWLNLRGVEL